MKIGLYNLEPKYTNIAIEKIRLFWQEQGAIVEKYFPLAHDSYGTIYASSIFTFTSKEYVTPDMITGGTGFDLKKTLRPEIEAMKPKINVGFTSRGCIRRCKFCVVPEKEGKLRATGDIYDFWDGKAKEVTLLDNNILGLTKHFWLICNQLRKENIKADFNQGFDIRLINEYNAAMLSCLKPVRMWRFAFDSLSYEKEFRQGMRCLFDEGIKPCNIMVYILIGFDTSHDENMSRINICRDMGLRPFVMPFDKFDRYQSAFAGWVNNKACFYAAKWEDFKRNPDKRKKSNANI